MKTIQLTLNQLETNELLLSIEARMTALGEDMDASHTLKDLSILWDKLFDSGLKGGFANQYMAKDQDEAQ